MTSENDSDVLLALDGPVATLRFNRPQRRNALSLPMLSRFRDLLTEATRSDARVIILRGEGRDFCVGADIDLEAGPTPDFSYEGLASIYDTAKLLHETPQVTIAAIDGGCAGPGLA